MDQVILVVLAIGSLCWGLTRYTMENGERTCARRPRLLIASLADTSLTESSNGTGR